MGDMRFRKIREDDLELIMNWRMRPDITMYMNTDPKLTIEGQRKWYEKICKEDDTFYWIVESDGKACGLVSLVNWDKDNSIIHTGAYIAEKDCRSLENIINMNMNLFAYAMEEVKVNRISVEILHHNIGQLKWMHKFGATKEGVLRQAVKKGDEYYDMHIFSILADEWKDILSKVFFKRIDIEK
ncbi:MAG: GNAT family N-acetyltransferase [Lachnospiraceae bacterium]|nr:GNAT family N-acetyltransferase [Lachnospiraceae bacterium]